MRQLLPGLPEDCHIDEICHWVDFRILPTEFSQALESQTHRRFMQSHVPQQYIPTELHDKACFITVLRDGRDVAWSFYNHHRHFVPKMYGMLDSGKFDGPKFPVFDTDSLSDVEYFERWLDCDGYPLWSFWDLVRSWWAVRNHPRVLLVHYANLKKNPIIEIQRIYEFVRRFGEVRSGLNDSVVRTAFERSTFEHMKNNGDKLAPLGGRLWKDGSDSFFNKGKNGQWKEVLPMELSKRYEDMAERQLGAECASWLATGQFQSKQ